MTDNNKKRIGIIGAGPGGLTSGKTSLECGFDVKIFDKNNSIGGVWSKEGKAWDNMVTHISYVSMSFSDFQWNVPDEDKPFYPKREQMYEYLLDYSKHFNILDKIKLNTNVLKVSPLKNKKWSIKYCNNDNPLEVNEEIFDYVIVSSGMFSKKREINIKKKLENFKGNIYSSDQYKNIKPFINRNVLVIGSFSSGIEISADIGNVSKQVYLTSRRNSWILKRGFPNNGNDVFDHCLQKRKLVYSNLNNTEFNILKYNHFNISSNQTKNKYFPITIPNYYEQSFIISDNFIDILETGKIKVIDKNIIKTNDNKVYFKDSEGWENIEVDDIILCDGYDIDLSFFDQYIKDTLSLDLNCSHLPILLYNNVFSPNLDNIGFVGFYKAAGMIEMEMMARFVIYHFTGLFNLPDKETMLKSIKNEQFEIRRLNEYYNRPQFPINSIKYCDLLAKEIGVLPDLNQLKENDPLLYEINENKMFHPSFYRLIGPFSNYLNSKNLLISDYNHYFIKKNIK